MAVECLLWQNTFNCCPVFVVTDNGSVVFLFVFLLFLTTHKWEEKESQTTRRSNITFTLWRVLVTYFMHYETDNFEWRWGVYCVTGNFQWVCDKWYLFWQCMRDCRQYSWRMAPRHTSPTPTLRPCLEKGLLAWMLPPLSPSQLRYRSTPL